MDGTQFDALTKALIAGTTRRRTLAGLFIGVLGLPSLLVVENAGAKSCAKKCQNKKNCNDKKNNNAKNRCRRGCRKQCRRQDEGAGFCAGKNNCVAEARCEQSGPECFCFIKAGSGEPFCGRNANTGINCTATTVCGAGETCVDLTGCGLPFNTACAVTCGNPR